ncbi:hypothetical protein [Roseiconus lacunae]|uniref:Uncharacterized protein n=1 Tax=Roseiconus lacunae TaxID=2605694 RepID=A0ABT7PEC2_9BACT|nr:hypothetical protein [Roseiconus lacunae]MCD0463604.1 hypothetical protein [Roseiconus lacunae]MDM4014838.1 hypothetical protein [Roseiconus lacunae]WRQ50428.1 hypothetical protein U8335_26185 [Stieleria sp. HD01]
MNLESTRQKSTEVEAFQRLHGMELQDACELVCLAPELYRGADTPLDWLPSPSEIELMTAPLRKEKKKQLAMEREDLTPPLLRGLKA